MQLRLAVVFYIPDIGIYGCAINLCQCASIAARKIRRQCITSHRQSYWTDNVSGFFLEVAKTKAVHKGRLTSAISDIANYP